MAEEAHWDEYAYREEDAHRERGLTNKIKGWNFSILTNQLLYIKYPQKGPLSFSIYLIVFIYLSFGCLVTYIRLIYKFLVKPID